MRTGVVLAALALWGVAVLFATLGPPRPAAVAPLIAAHRGGALLWPENSLLAFRGAVALGADFLELDVHLSRDGEVVVIHDSTLDRTTTGTGPVRDRTLAELRALRLRDRSGAATGEAVPTLEEVAALAAAGKRQMLLEIKVDDQRRRYPGIEEKALAILDRHGVAPATVVMAFEEATWRRMRELRPDLRVAALYSPRMISQRGSSLARELEAAREAGLAVVGLHQDLVDADAVALARKSGLTLGVWTVNEPAAIRRLVALGVGTVISDRPDLVKEALGR